MASRFRPRKNLYPLLMAVVPFALLGGWTSALLVSNLQAGMQSALALFGLLPTGSAHLASLYCGACGGIIARAYPRVPWCRHHARACTPWRGG